LDHGGQKWRQPNRIQELFHDTLKDIYCAEPTILNALPNMRRAVQTADLQAAFEKHKGETEGHVKRPKATAAEGRSAANLSLIQDGKSAM
jgi:ferritin-like metal-binding protein YciE